MKLDDENKVNHRMLQATSEADSQAAGCLSRNKARCCLADLPGDLFFMFFHLLMPIS